MKVLKVVCKGFSMTLFCIIENLIHPCRMILTTSTRHSLIGLASHPPHSFQSSIRSQQMCQPYPWRRNQPVHWLIPAQHCLSNPIQMDSSCQLFKLLLNMNYPAIKFYHQLQRLRLQPQKNNLKICRKQSFILTIQWSPQTHLHWKALALMI